MKKLLGMLALIGVFSGIAGANCLTVEFDNRDSFCLSLDKSGRTYSASIEDRDLSSGPNTLRCELLLPDNSLEDLGACNGSFTYSSSKEEKVKLYIRYNSTYYTVITSYLDFSDGTWGDSDSDINGGSRSKNSGLSISVDDTTLGKSDYTNMIIETDDYDGKIDFTVEYKDGSYETIAKRDYGDYFYDYKNDLVNGVSISNDDYENIKDFIKFKKEGTYRITAEDEDDNTDYVVFTVGDDDDDDDNENEKIEISTNDKTVDTNEYVDVTIETDSDYRGKVNLSAEYKSSDSSSWKSVTNTSSTYFYTNYSTDWENGYYKMTSSDKGEVDLDNLVKFKKEGSYRITVEDEDDNTDYVVFTVGDDDDDDDNENEKIEISTNDKTVDTNEYVDVTIETDSDYRGKVNLSAEYKSTDSSSWKSVSNTSSTYFYTNYSTDWKNGYYKMTSSDKGEVDLDNLVKFKKEGSYRITVEDEDDNTDYVVFTVGDDDDDDDDENEKIEISTNDKTVDTNEYVDVTIETDSDYRGKVNLSAEYKSSDSSSWKSVTNTSSNYFNNYSTDWKKGYYQMTSSDKGEVDLDNLVKFKKEGYYKIIAEDTDNNDDSLVFSVGDVDKYDDDDDSDIDGFTVKEEAKLKGIIDLWDRLISELKSESYKLRNDSTWLNEADRIDKKMKKTRDGKSDGYDSFFDLKTDLVKWISYAQLHQ